MTKRRVKFLLVDDREANLLALGALLKRDGLELLIANSGAEALELLLKHEVALIFLDVQMPDMNGFELAELMRGAERTRRVPIIFVTAGATDTLRRFRGYELGAVDFLFKPIDPDILLAKAEVFYELARQRIELVEIAEENSKLLATIRQREEQYRTVLESQGEMLCRFRLDGTILFANRAYAQNRGTVPEDLVERSFWEFIPKEEHGRVRSMLGKLKAECPEIQIENQFETKAGIRWTLWTNRALKFDESGMAIELQSTGIDITDRKIAEEKLQHSYEMFFGLIQKAPFGVYLVDAEFRLAQVSSGSSKVFIQVDPLIGRDFGEILRSIWPEPFAGEVEAQFRHTLATGEPFHSSETTEQRKDTGEVESYDWRIEQIALPGGEHGVVCYFYDITDRRRATEALRESEARFRNMADHSPMMIWVADGNGQCAYVNKQWMTFTGLEVEKSLGEGWLDAIHPLDRARAQITLGSAREKRERLRLEYRLQTREGDYRWTIHSAAPRFSAMEEFMGYIGSIVDIDDEKQAAQILERTVADRTAKLRESNEHLEAFVYSIAHDLRAPLRSMNGYSQLLQSEYAGQLDETGKSFLLRIQESSEFMDKLLLDLLNFGRTASMDVELAPVEVRAAWESAVKQCAAQIEETRAEIRTGETLPKVRAHEATLAQCLANLLSNALRFVNPGTTPVIEFSAEVEGERARLQVKDNGIGIPSEQHERIFRVFERLNGGDYGGTGIGLSIVRKGVERMDGQIGLKSNPGEGSCFWIDLIKA